MASEGERAPELLRADKEQLDRAAELLKGEESGFVIVACPPELTAAARARMVKQAGVEIPEPVVLQGSEEALEALVGATLEGAAAKVRSLAIGGDAKEALRALNWHREKLLRGAPAVLWVGGVDGLVQMREVAPDAYAFRDVVVMLRGDRGRVPQVSHKESKKVLEARRRLVRAKTAMERAFAYSRLSDALRVQGHLIEAENTARRGLEALPSGKYTDENARVARARLWSRVASAARERGSQVRSRQAVYAGLDEIRDLHQGAAQERRVWLLAGVPGPAGGFDRVSVEQAYRLAQELGENRETSLRATRVLARGAAWRGDITGARRLLGAFNLEETPSVNHSFVRVDQGEIERMAGRFSDAESYLLQAISLAKGEDADIAIAADLLALCWLERGEIETAERITEESAGSRDPARETEKYVFLANLEAAKGDIARAQEEAQTALRDSAWLGLDRLHVLANESLKELTTEAHDAGRLDGAMLLKVAAELEVEEDVCRAITSNDPPPWYAIWFLSYRAAILIRTERQAEALSLARGALSLARTTCEDLIPETGRTLADHLLRAASPNEALSLLVEIEPEAASRGMLEELARVLAARVLALVLRYEPPSAIEPAVAALREALESTGAPRIKAEILQELAIRLPSAATLPDPLALAAETHTLFVEMPMPVKEARSLELAGDVLAARGKPDEARRRYLTAKGILERRGLGLRLPLVTSKLERLA